MGVDSEGNDCTVEEFIDENGNKKIKNKRIIKDENGNDIEIEEIINEKGEKVTVKKREL